MCVWLMAVKDVILGPTEDFMSVCASLIVSLIGCVGGLGGSIRGGSVWRAKRRESSFFSPVP